MSIYAFSDLHGHLDLYKQIKEYVKPEDTLYCLGDCGDRGPQPWETIKAVLRDPQVTYLKGNHEDMLVAAAREALHEDMCCSYRQRVLANNGGMPTLEGLLAEEKVGMWIAELKKLPTNTLYINSSNKKILMSHAGFTWDGSLPEEEGLLWDRNHIWDSWQKNSPYIMLHGHTPWQHIVRELRLESPVDKPLWYNHGQKCCIDNWTYRTKSVFLLNLDTFESKMFTI